jgi:DNA-binding CsgD family transcriptional regulator
VGLRRILAVADVLLAAGEEAELVDQLLPVLRRAVPADTVLWLDADRRRPPSAWRAEPAGALTADQAVALDAHAADDPLLAAAWHGPGTPTRRSDLHTDQEFHRLPVFQALFAPLNARHQLIMAVRPDEQRRVVVLFQRAAPDPDFTQHDLAVAEALRPRIGHALARFAVPTLRPEEAERGGRARGGIVSPREADVLDLLCRGLTDRQIATRLGISPRTVDKHLEHAYVKLGVRCRVQAATRWGS